VNEAYSAALDKRDLCQEKRWTWTLRGRTIGLRDEVAKIAQWIDKFKAVGDVAVSADPLHAGLPWAGVRFILEAAVSENRQMGALLAGLKITLYMVHRLEAYVGYYGGLSPSLATENFKASLVNLYARVLEFLALAIITFQKGTFNRTVDSLFTTSDFDTFEADCDRLGQRAEIEASICERQQSSGREDAGQHKRALDQALKRLEQVEGIKDSLLRLKEAIDLASLPIASGAAFDSYEEEHTVKCYEDTRVQLRHDIDHWVQNPTGACIYWLKGMAGTGKSTIAKTIAQDLHDAGILGASFFFKRGEGDRGSARRLFSTLAVQLGHKTAQLSRELAQVLETTPQIGDKALAQQFNALILQPLENYGSQTASSLKLLIVLDALDECESKADIRVVLRLLAKLRSVKGLQMRVFVTSRPELPIELGFAEMLPDDHLDFVLHDIPKPSIEHDISAFYVHEFKTIRADYALRRPYDPLPDGWPGEGVIRSLVQQALPLFIFAATICRFVGDPKSSPVKRLEAVLQSPNSFHVSSMGRTYLPILNQLLVDVDEAEHTATMEQFRVIVGAIIAFAAPLSASSISALLDLSLDDISNLLGQLHSVLHVPASVDQPVRLLHLSFRDFLVDDKSRDHINFWVDEKKKHSELTNKCLDFLMKPGVLVQNICELQDLAARRLNIDQNTIDEKISPAVRYACRFWVFHLNESNLSIHCYGKIMDFMRKHFLHWIEVLSWLGRLSESIDHIRKLQHLASPYTVIDDLSPENTNTISAGTSSNILKTGATELVGFLGDAERFILQNRYIIDLSPLQLYLSGLTFAPSTSVIRQTFLKHGTAFGKVARLPHVPETWGAELLRLEGHTGCVEAIAFSPDGELIASGSSDKTVRLWNAKDGEEIQCFQHIGPVYALAFSHDAERLVIGGFRSLTVWHPGTGESKTHEIGNAAVNSVAVSPTASLIVAGSPKGGFISDLDLGQVRRFGTAEILDQYSRTSVAISDDGAWFAAASPSGVVLRSYGPGLQFSQEPTDSKLEPCSLVASTMQFMPTEHLLVIASRLGTVEHWDCVNNIRLSSHKFEAPRTSAHAISPDCNKYATASKAKTSRSVTTYDITTHAKTWQLKTDDHVVTTLAFTPNSDLLVIGSLDGTIRLCSPSIDATESEPLHHHAEVLAIGFSPDGTALASASKDGTVIIWDPAMGEKRGSLVHGYKDIYALALAPSATYLALATPDFTIDIWDVAAARKVSTLSGYDFQVRSLAISPDGSNLVAVCVGSSIWAWDLLSAIESSPCEPRLFKGSSGYHPLRFSCDGNCIQAGTTVLDLKSGLFSDPVVEDFDTPRLAVKDEWIQDVGRPIMWLPLGYREAWGPSLCWSAHNDVLAIGQSDGIVNFYSFS